ncbi:hypothetical protein HMN09_00459600 [Mycena chlorophos]|uniref:CxC2-like cysteine cluster KDZ transposase-associated domain-containing protein n=1 Tax=Mycena chlorophos TaxID=658473 RepID=A0A8H6TK94_MYCCL|nr:hypothetical protein HMN09_00459600 [Mycena chlorophos]
MRRFEAQIGPIADGMESWDHLVEQEGPDAVYLPPEGVPIHLKRVYVVDIFQEGFREVPFLVGDDRVAPTLVKQGLIPCTPVYATVAFTTRTLTAFHAMKMRCPRLGKQAFLRSLNDIHGIAPRPYMQVQFSVAYDVYLRAREEIRIRVARDLGRDSLNWRLKNACPACLYKVQGQPELNPPFLCTHDGNSSLKRVESRHVRYSENGEKVVGGCNEVPDDRKTPQDYYLEPEVVNRFAKDSPEVAEAMRDFQPDPNRVKPDQGCGEGPTVPSQENLTDKARGIFKETGLFASFCRHSVTLVLVDMIESGESAKYGLSITCHLLAVLGKHVLGYDIGCKFEQWVYEHPLVCKLAEEKGFSAVVGAFHITGHLRQCQLRNMPLYRDGMGLEAVENAENIFSKSNALAGTTRHASAFHRRQDIVNYFSHSDNFDALANIVSLIHNKYRRALEVLSKEEDLLDYMNTNNITERSVFEQWLVDEEAALQKLSKEPLEETLQMEYVRKLGDYYACQVSDKLLPAFFTGLGIGAKLEALVESIGQEPIPGGRARDFPARMAKWNKQNAERRRTENKLERLATAVEAMEEQLNLRTGQRWKRNSQEWKAAEALLRKRRFQRALDRLQYCVVSRLLQLSKTHMVGTSYHMRQHIAKAISSGANALQNALSEYNSAADELGEGHPQLTWEEILEMGVLEDFDLLRLGREDIRDAAWAQPGARVAMDLHFRLLRAQEEIIRCNVEIKQFATWMKEEREFLVYQERRVASEGRHARALQIRKHRMLQGRFFAIHRERLEKLRNMEGFTGDIEPGVGVCEIRRSVREAPGTLDADQEAEIVQAMQQVALEEEQDGGDGTGAQDDEGHEEEEEYAYFAHAALMAWMDEEQVQAPCKACAAGGWECVYQTPGNARKSAPSLELISDRATLLEVVALFFKFVYPTAPCVHKPTFMAALDNRDDRRDPMFLSLVLSVVACALVHTPSTFLPANLDKSAARALAEVRFIQAALTPAVGTAGELEGADLVAITRLCVGQRAAMHWKRFQSARAPRPGQLRRPTSPFIDASSRIRRQPNYQIADASLCCR